MTNPLTPLSITYRLRASAVGNEAFIVTELEMTLKHLHQALAWIQLAENEEVLSAANCEVVQFHRDR